MTESIPRLYTKPQIFDNLLTEENISDWPLIFGIFLIGAGFYFVLGRQAQVLVTQQLLSQQQTVARAEKSNIITFFERFGDGVATLAQLNSIERRDADVLEEMDIFMEQRKDTGIIYWGGVILTDKEGELSSMKREYYISRPIIGRLGASKDQTIAVVASPVYRETKFSGVIASSVKLEPLVERFFGLMKVSDTTKVYVVDESGDIIYTNSDPQAPGYQTFKDKIENALSSDNGGQFTTDKYLVAYSPVTLGVQKWLLIVSSPAQEVMEQAIPFHIRQAVMFIATTIIIFLCGSNHILSFRGFSSFWEIPLPLWHSEKIQPLCLFS